MRCDNVGRSALLRAIPEHTRRQCFGRRGYAHKWGYNVKSLHPPVTQRMPANLDAGLSSRTWGSRFDAADLSDVSQRTVIDDAVFDSF